MLVCVTTIRSDTLSCIKGSAAASTCVGCRRYDDGYAGRDRKPPDVDKKTGVTLELRSIYLNGYTNGKRSRAALA